jgi:hypothetical protein
MDGVAITASAFLRRYSLAVRHNFHRYYGAGDLHFITCSCYRRQPLLGTARRGSGPPFRILGEVTTIVGCPTLRDFRRVGGTDRKISSTRTLSMSTAWWVHSSPAQEGMEYPIYSE